MFKLIINHVIRYYKEKIKPSQWKIMRARQKRMMTSRQKASPSFTTDVNDTACTNERKKNSRKQI